MVSAFIPGIVTFKVVSRDGSRVKSASYPLTTLCGSVGSSEGIKSTSATPDKLMKEFKPNLPFGRAGDFLEVWFKPNAAKTTDASDAVWEAPITKGNQYQLLTNSADSRTGFKDYSFLTDFGDKAMLADVDVMIARREIVGAPETWGYPGSSCFLSIEDNA